MSAACWVGIAAAAMLAFGWLGYPVVLVLLTRLRRRPQPSAPAPSLPGITVIIATRDAPEVMRRRLTDLRGGHRAGEDLDIAVAVDHTSSYPLAEYDRACAGMARIIPGDAPGGKACTLNAAVRSSSRPLLIFTNSFQSFADGAISRLVAAMSDPSVGATTGTLVLGSDGPTSGPLRLFWAYELLLRRLETEVDSVTVVTGAIYALRRELWRPLPAGLICDDLLVALQVVRQGLRVSASTEAVATDPRGFTHSQEFRRKVRTLTGIIQVCRLFPWVLNPVRNRIWFQFICHKMLRLATPYLVLAALGAGLSCVGAQARGPTPLLVAGGVLAALLLVAAAAGRLRRLPAQLLLAGSLLLAPIVATIHAARGKWNVW
jgi:cellulose synthase/poly-beta-1,6-N-acetylglucosamine synthase-like glycosyltransferase